MIRYQCDEMYNGTPTASCGDDGMYMISGVAGGVSAWPRLRDEEDRTSTGFFPQISEDGNGFVSKVDNYTRTLQTKSWHLKTWGNETPDLSM